MLSIIAPIFNRPEYTSVFLEHLYEVDHGVPVQIIISDNGSRRKTKETVKSWVEKWPTLPSDVKLRIFEPMVVWGERNAGFAGAINAALTAVTQPYITVLHNDALPFAGWAKEIIHVFETADDDIGIVIPRTLYSNEGSPCIPELRKEFEAIKPPNKDRITPEEIKAIVTKLFPDGQEAFLKTLPEKYPLRYSYSPEISSFCMTFKKELIDQYGKFDEDFWPRGYEDALWFRKIERDGLICMISNHSFCFHFGNISSDGAGFCFADNMRMLEEKFKTKCLEMDKIGATQKTSV